MFLFCKIKHLWEDKRVEWKYLPNIYSIVYQLLKKIDTLCWLLSKQWTACPHLVMIRYVPVAEEGHATCSQPALRQFALIFDDVTSIYYQEIWDVYNVNC